MMIPHGLKTSVNVTYGMRRAIQYGYGVDGATF